MQILEQTRYEGLDPVRAFVAFGGGRVRLAGEQRPRDGFVATCGNPDCACTEASFTFVDPSDGDAFTVKVDLAAGTGKMERGAPADPDRVVAEVVQDTRPLARPLLDRLAAFRLRKPDVARLDLSPDWIDAHVGLLPLSHILAGGRVERSQGAAGFYDRLEADGATWTVHDLFCGREGCDCREAVLDFQRQDGAGAFAARVDLSGGTFVLGELQDLDAAEARRVFARWWSTPRADRKVLSARYRAVRDLASRPLRPVSVAPRPIGGKEPCPCGSGKRYKRCCGAR